MLHTHLKDSGAKFAFGVKINQNFFFFMQISLTNYSICFVLVDSGSYQTFSFNKSLPAGKFRYHRLDMTPPTAVCYHLNRTAAKGTLFELVKTILNSIWPAI